MPLMAMLLIFASGMFFFSAYSMHKASYNCEQAALHWEQVEKVTGKRYEDS